MNRDSNLLDSAGDDDYVPEFDVRALEDQSVFEAPLDPPEPALGEDEGDEDDDGDAIDDANDTDHTSRGPITDDEISARVRRLLRIDAATSMLRVHVSTEDGVVTLRGMVQTLDDTDNAAEVASRVEGVVDVLDELEVE